NREPPAAPRRDQNRAAIPAAGRDGAAVPGPRSTSSTPPAKTRAQPQQSTRSESSAGLRAWRWIAAHAWAILASNNCGGPLSMVQDIWSLLKWTDHETRKLPKPAPAAHSVRRIQRKLGLLPHPAGHQGGGHQRRKKDADPEAYLRSEIFPVLAAEDIVGHAPEERTHGQRHQKNRSNCQRERAFAAGLLILHDAQRGHHDAPRAVRHCALAASLAAR